MYPVLLQRGGLVLPGDSVVLLAAFVVGGLVRRAESRRLGYGAQPGYAWVSVGALMGAVVGSKLGMLLYVERSSWRQVFEDLLRLETSGKTVIGALIGGYLGVEIAKKLVGIRSSTGDAFAVAVPLSLGIGRIACVLGGCCYGTPSNHVWAIQLAGAHRHPVQLYEAALDFALAAVLYWGRSGERPPGALWKASLLGYASIRLWLDPFRGDARVWIGPLSAVQVVCAAASAGLLLALLRSYQAMPRPER